MYAHTDTVWIYDSSGCMFGPNVGMEKKVLEVFGSFEPGCGVVLFNIVISFLYVESILFYPLVEKNRIKNLYLSTHAQKKPWISSIG